MVKKYSLREIFQRSYYLINSYGLPREFCMSGHLCIFAVFYFILVVLFRPQMRGDLFSSANADTITEDP